VSRGSFEVEFDVLAHTNLRNRFRDLGDVVFDAWPTRTHENHNTQPSSKEILLVTELLVRCN